MAEMFNTLFSKVSQLLEQKIKLTAKGFTEYLSDQITSSFVIEPTNTEEVYQEIKKIIKGKATGPNNLHTTVINNVPNNLVNH